MFLTKYVIKSCVSVFVRTSNEPCAFGRWTFFDSFFKNVFYHSNAAQFGSSKHNIFVVETSSIITYFSNLYIYFFQSIDAMIHWEKQCLRKSLLATSHAYVHHMYFYTFRIDTDLFVLLMGIALLNMCGSILSSLTCMEHFLPLCFF